MIIDYNTNLFKPIFNLFKTVQQVYIYIYICMCVEFKLCQTALFQNDSDRSPIN